jgi:cyclopropane fatty-acyl-phospholipid synthase-like methyltransferase
MAEASRSTLAASLDADEVVVPFVPELLKDLWSLGFAPDPALELIGRNLASHDRSVLDLGCGKGALLIHIAKEFGWKCRGIDIVPEFIAAATRMAEEYRVSHLVQFEMRDIRNEVIDNKQWDLISFGFDSAVLGPFEKALGFLRNGLSRGGHLLVDTVLERDGWHHEEVMTRQQVESVAHRANLELIDVEVLDPEWVRIQNTRNTELIRQRSLELANRYPEHAAAFDAYVREQENECRFLSEEVMCVLLLFRALK